MMADNEVVSWWMSEATLVNHDDNDDHCRRCRHQCFKTLMTSWLTKPKLVSLALKMPAIRPPRSGGQVWGDIIDSTLYGT